MAVQDKIIDYSTKSHSVKAYIDRDTVWLSVEDIALLYDKPLHIIIRQIKLIYTTDRMNEFLTMQSRRVRQADGREKIVSYYNLQMILAIGNQLQLREGLSFYKWAMKQLIA